MRVTPADDRAGQKADHRLEQEFKRNVPAEAKLPKRQDGRNVGPAETGWGLNRDVLSRDPTTAGTAGALRQSLKDKFSPIMEEDVSGRSPRLQASLLSPLTGTETTSTDSTATVKRSSMPQTPGSTHAVTPSYPFPAMSVDSEISTDSMTPGLHRPFTALSPTIAPSHVRSADNQNSKGRTVVGYAASAAQKGDQSMGNLRAVDAMKEQGMDFYEIVLKLQSEPGLEKWWINVCRILRAHFGATRATLAVPSDSTDIENVPWAQLATFTATDDPISSANTKDFHSTHSGATDSSVQDEAKSETSPRNPEKLLEPTSYNWTDVSSNRPSLQSRHSFAGFPQRLEPPTLESRQGSLSQTQRPSAPRATSYVSLRGSLPGGPETSHGTKLSTELLEKHLATQIDKSSHSTNTTDTRETATRARILPVLQSLELESDNLLNSAGAIRVLERSQLVHVTREYYDGTGSIDHRHIEGSDHRTLWPNASRKSGKSSGSVTSRLSRSSSMLSSRSTTRRPRSYTSNSSKSTSGQGSNREEMAESLSRTLIYEDYDQIPPSPWSQSPAPSPAIQGDPEANPFFVSARVDEEAFADDPPAHDYTSDRQIEMIGVDHASSIVHVPLIHPLHSRTKRQRHLREFCGNRAKKRLAEDETSSASLGSYPQTSLSSSEDEKKTPIAIVSVMAPTVPYPSSLSTSLNILAPHLATSLYNARQHTELEKQLLGASRRQHSINPNVEARSVHQKSEYSALDAISPPGTESATSTSEYSGTSMHSPRGSNAGTPSWDLAAHGQLDESNNNRPQIDYALDTGENYFNLRRKKSSTRRPNSGQGSAPTIAGTAGMDPSIALANLESVLQGVRTRPDQQSPPIEPKLTVTSGTARPAWRTKPVATVQIDDRPILPQPSGETLERSQTEPPDTMSVKRTGSPSRRHGENSGSPRRQAILQASGQANERSQNMHRHLHTHGANFAATNPSLPATAAKLPSALPKGGRRSPREEDFAFRPPTSSMMRMMIDSGAIQEFIAEPVTGNISWANARFLTYRNEAAAQIRRKPWSTIHPKDQKDFRRRWADALHAGDQLAYQVRLKRFDGQYRWFHLRISPIKDSYATIKHWHGQAMDIHDQHVAELNAAREKEKSASESKYRSLANSNPHIIFAASVPQGMTFANTQWLSYSGQDFDDALGFGFLNHVHPDDILKCHFPAFVDTSFRVSGTSLSDHKIRDRGNKSSASTDTSETSTSTNETIKFHKLDSPVVEIPPALAPSGLLRNLAAKGIIKASKDGQGRLSIASEMRLKSKTGQYRWHLVQGSLIESVNFGQGDAQWIIACADISDQKRIEEKLKDANSTLESETTRKMQFLSTMSHEIRTPLNGIIGNLQFLLNSDLDDYQSEWTYGAAASARGMHDLINDILDVSKAEAKMLTLYYDWFHLRSIIEDVFETLVSKANEKGLELCYFMDKEVPSHIKGDAGRIRQVLLNLVGNAVKFTQRGEVLVDCSVKKTSAEELPSARSENDEITLLFKVQDTGNGFTEEDAKVLFRPYSQLDNSSTRSNGGTGLGLLLCKQMVELHHGEISAVSNPGKGSTFTFSARFKLPTASDHPELARRPSLGTSSSMNSLRDKTQVFNRGIVVSPSELSVKAETVESSGSSDLSVASSVRTAQISIRSSASSIDSIGNFAAMKLTLPSKEGSADERKLPEVTLPTVPEILHPPMYSILIVCPHEHTRRATEAYIQQILPRSIPAQVATSGDVNPRNSMMSQDEPIKFTHVVLQLNETEHVLAYLDLIFNSKHYPQTCVVIITDQAQQSAIIAGEPSFDYDRLCATEQLHFLLKPAKPPKFAKIFDPKQESALSRDHVRASAVEKTDMQKQAFKKFEEWLGGRGLRVLAVEDNKLNMKVCIFSLSLHLHLSSLPLPFLLLLPSPPLLGACFSGKNFLLSRLISG